MALKFFALFVVVCLCVEALNALTLTKRSVASSTSAANLMDTEICQGRTPCGWAVYNKLNRFIDYFMKNKCSCSKEKKCLRDDDDISITAYVYRCKVDTPTPAS